MAKDPVAAAWPLIDALFAAAFDHGLACGRGEDPSPHRQREAAMLTRLTDAMPRPLPGSTQAAPSADGTILALDDAYRALAIENARVRFVASTAIAVASKALTVAWSIRNNPSADESDEQILAALGAQLAVINGEVKAHG